MVDIIDKDGNPVMDENPNAKGEIVPLSYHIEKKVIPFLDYIKTTITKNDKDYVIIIDGYEGSGKSTLGMQFGKYVDPTLSLDRICLTSEEFKNAITTAKKGNCVIYDEAVTGLSSGESITRVGRILKSMMMQMRQKNLFVIIIIPTFFDLGHYAVLSRAKSLFHTYESKGKMGYWVGYNKKSLRNLYLKGKRTYSYRVKSRFNGRFYGKYPINEVAYRKKKEDALFFVGDERKKTLYDVRIQKERDGAIIWLLEMGKSYKEIEDWYRRKGIPFDISKVKRLKYNNMEIMEKVV